MNTGQDNILITGTSSGIGLAAATVLLNQGFNVVGLSRSKANINHPNFQHISIDLANLNSLETALKAIRKNHSTINHLICNAGCGEFGSLEELSVPKIQHLINLNLTSQIILTKIFLPQLKQQRKGGRIIFMGSEAALQGGQKGTIYSASKFAMRGFAQSLREECSKSGICISIINPGMVKSAFFDSLKFSPGDEEDQHLLCEDVAQAILMLISARYGNCIEEINLSPQKKVIKFT